MTRTITAAEYRASIAAYDEAYAAGETWTTCTFCERPVVERTANWDHYPGSGVVLHEHCVGHWIRGWVARDWWRLGFGVIGDNWYVGRDGRADEYMRLFAYCLGLA